MGVLVVYDKQIKMPPQGVKVFSVEITATEDLNVFLRFEDINAVCYNCSGIDYLGEKFNKTVSLKKGVPHKLWCGISSAGKGYITVYGDKNTLLFKDEIRAEISENAEYAEILEYAEFSTVPSSSSMSADVLVGSPSVLLLPRNITGNKTAPTTATEATAEVTIVLILIFFAGGIVPLTMTPVTSNISDNQQIYSS